MNFCIPYIHNAHNHFEPYIFRQARGSHLRMDAKTNFFSFPTQYVQSFQIGST